MVAAARSKREDAPLVDKNGPLLMGAEVTADRGNSRRRRDSRQWRCSRWSWCCGRRSPVDVEPVVVVAGRRSL